MPATVVIRSFHGVAGATVNDIDNGSMRFKAADDDTVDANNPLVIPGAGSVYSYIKQLKLRITGTAPSNSISNIKFYSDGANGLPANGSPGGSVKVWGKTNASYVNPITQAQTALTSVTDVFTYTSGSPLAITGSGTTANTDLGDYLELQMEITSAAIQGTSGTETLTMQYDES